MSIHEPVITSGVHEPPALEFAVNFGIFAGREVSRLELERLAESLLAEVGSASLFSELRYAVGQESTVELHQVRVEIAPEALPAGAEPDALRARVEQIIAEWARSSIAGFSLAEMTEPERLAHEAVVGDEWEAEQP
ncbi:MAG: hypothetical protein ACRDNX_14310 [Gaiellaceae bacterium]